MEYLIICIVALLASGLTLFSGFGLGTILVPAFALFFPIELAIALTAIVHFLNNLFKLALLGKYADKKIIVRFGIPSILASLVGASLLTRISHASVLFTYSIAESSFSVVPVKLLISAVLLFFALFEIIPSLSKLQFEIKYLFVGGLISGFFGGLSGNQGALRSAFLMKVGLSKEVFIATGVVIACLVDIPRLFIYSGSIIMEDLQMNYLLMSFATLSAFLGAFLGNRLLKKITINSLHVVVSVALIIFSVLLGAGII